MSCGGGNKKKKNKEKGEMEEERERSEIAKEGRIHFAALLNTATRVRCRESCVTDTAAAQDRAGDDIRRGRPER